MPRTFPGMTVEALHLQKGASRILFDGIFATGGITLSQVSVMTGLEPYMIQNWVKRGFVSSPQKRVYSKEQFARIVIINMLREAIQIDRICSLIETIADVIDDTSDHLKGDDDLYHFYVDMIADGNINTNDEGSVTEAALRATAEVTEKEANAKRQLVKILKIMLYAHTASRLKTSANEILLMLN
jgi:DNA-binding transcriptional MerR regulator